MNTLQIKRAITGLKVNSLGVYAADRIPRVFSLPAAIVANTDTSDKPGTHWIAIYIDQNGDGKYFDSYGVGPIIPYHIDRIRRNCKRYEWNDQQIQSFDSQVCGEYCIMFLHYMCSGYSLRTFMRLFGGDTYKNDVLVKKYYKKILTTLKRKHKYLRANTFVTETRVGLGMRNQYCTNKIR